MEITTSDLKHTGSSSVIAALYRLFILIAGLLLASSFIPTVQAATDCAAVTDVPQIECEALVALYNSTNSAGWTDVHDGNTEDLTVCDWYGVTCGGGHVIAIYLYDNQLTGSIPPELGNLSQLTQLGLWDNQLTGNIPAELGNLTNLTMLQLYNNQFTGSIPPELGNLTNLKHLNLFKNQLTGSIPASLGNLTNLITLHLHTNQLSGSIPAELGNLTNLIQFHLYKNQLSGSIPPELGSLTNLTDLYLFENRLSGSIPPELGNLTNLFYFSLHHNQLSGSIPPELGNLTNLFYLSLHNNQLSGSIPPELGSMPNLIYLSLHHNQLSGSIPPELGSLTHLYELYLNNNLLQGEVPSSITNLISLDILDLSCNTLTITDTSVLTFVEALNPNWGQCASADSPTIVNDSYSTSFQTLLIVNTPGVLANDTDPESEPLTATLISGPAYDTLFTFNIDGSFSYMPQSGFTGMDTFTYQASDGFNLSNTAIVTIIVGAAPSPSPTLTPIATPTVAPTSIPLEGMHRIAPADGAVVDQSRQYTPQFQWFPVDGAAWYHVYVSSADYSQVFWDQWYRASDVCSGAVCTTPTDIWVVGDGNFVWWMTYWTEEVGNGYVDIYNMTTFTLNFPLPGAITGGAPTGEVADGDVNITWQNNPNVLWYQIWIGPDTYLSFNYFNWQEASEICSGDTCTLEIPGTLTSGGYEVWIQPWNPTGFNPDTQGWQLLTEFTVAP